MTGWKAIRVFALVPMVGLVFGCGKSTPEQVSPPPAPVSSKQSMAPETTLQIHWLGKSAISADANSTNLMRLWDLPETLKLQAQTLDKLCAAPWRLLLGQTNETSANLLRPLLDDIVAQECYLEIRKATNTSEARNEIVLSVHLNADRADLWQSKLATIMQSLGAAPVARNPSGWKFSGDNRSNLVEFARAGEWSVLSVAPDHNALLDETIGRIKSQQTPMIVSSANAFLEGFVDLGRVGRHSSSNALPRLSFAYKLDNDSVVTTGEMLFPERAATKLPPWSIPTNLISGTAVSITAVRGLAPYIASSKFWQDLNAGSPPDQCFIWATRESPMQTYFVAPMVDASNAAGRISELALRKQGPTWLTNALAGFEKSKTSDGLSWRGFPFFTPFLRSASIDGENFLIGGFLNVDMPVGPPPAGVVDGILSKNNLVYYDRELTGIHVEQWIQLGQAIRFASGASQLPGDSASFQWLKAMGSRLGTSSTEITQTAPGRLSFARKSDIGFCAIELHMLGDWLESPEFPLGTYSLLVRSPEPPPL